MYSIIKTILRRLRRLRRSSAKTACQSVPWDLLPFSFEVDWYRETPKGVDESACFHAGGMPDALGFPHRPRRFNSLHARGVVTVSPKEET